MSINCVVLSGNLGGDVELRYTSSGKPVANLNLAVNTGFGDKKETAWIRVTVWDKTAELCGQYLKKGSKIGVTGRLSSREYEKDGQKRTVLEVIAEKIEFLDSANSGNQTNAATAGADTTEEETAPF